VAPRLALSYLSDARNLPEWSFGAMQPTDLTQARCVGRHLLDDALVEISVAAGADGRTVEFHCAKSGRSGPLLITAKVTRASAGGCRIALIAERIAELDAADWRLLRSSHEVEIRILRTRLEARAAGGQAPARAQPMPEDGRLPLR